MAEKIKGASAPEAKKSRVIKALNREAKRLDRLIAKHGDLPIGTPEPSAPEANATAAKALIAASRDTFGLHPEDVIGSINSASEVCDWLEEIFVSISREAEGKGCTTRIKRLAAVGAYLASDMGNFYDSQHEEMFASLKAVGIVAAEVAR